MATITENDKYVLNAIFNPNYPLDFDQPDTQDTSYAKNEKIKALESEGVRLAEQNRFEEAIDHFSQAIEFDSEQPSAYNNRAQAYQLQHQPEKAMADLNTAIELASKSKSFQKTLSLALTQRAILHRFLGHDQASLADFSQAADLGCNFAKQQVLLSNPYAAACNQMLSKMLKSTSYN